MNIPEDHIDFLHWVKETTESFWAKKAPIDKTDFICDDWIKDAKWLGLDNVEIDAIEQRYNIKFSDQYRAFLNILHTIDKKEITEYTESLEENAPIIKEESDFFHDWRKPPKEIQKTFRFPYESILQDVIGVNRVWLKSWGEIRPKSDTKKKAIFDKWFKQWPFLIPIRGGRYMINDSSKKENPVLSISGSDIIVYGWNFRHYLINELENHLNLTYLKYDETDHYYYSELKEDIKLLYEYEFSLAQKKSIPIIEEMILYWSSGWSSFGLKYPYKNPEYGCPIINTFVAKDEE